MLTRRNVLRGLGVTLSLPLLESLAPRRAHGQDAAARKRFIPIYFPNGAGVEWWDKPGSGKTWELPPLFRVIEPVKSKSLLIRNLGNYTWRRDLLTMSPAWHTTIPRQDLGTLMPAGAYALPAHSRDPGAMLCCVDGDGVRKDRGLDVATSPVNAITADQVIAKALAGKTPIQSMQLGLFNGSGDFDQRNSVFSQNMSWDTPETPMGKELNVQKVFDSLIAGGAGATTPDPVAEAEAAKRKALDKSALDSLKASTAALQSKLSTSDRAELDKYLTGVRELELKVDGSTPLPMVGCTPIERPMATTDPHQDPVGRMGIINDLIVMALQCDMTRIITYMLDNSRSELIYGHVPKYDFTSDKAAGGMAGGNHQAQHAGLRSNDFASITNWQLKVAVDLATKLDAVQEGERTLLDNTLLMLFSDMHHGDHASFDLPMILFGGAGTFRQGEYVTLPEDAMSARQYRDLYFTIMNQYFELGVQGFGEDMRQVPNALITEILA